jgi:methyl-accepting chemotaxis protein
MAASAHEISRQVARVTTEVSVDHASQTDMKVTSLADAADRTGDVVGLISDVSGQTNLLRV